ncbi:hypothetical protein EDB81DRAFT_767236 [Dactylonectria macrodidyma]|uniref:Uncharacterized protein n=1 Tax=Dactylonectria macrodidyma TaxID=307937 RepID=A0A9P9DE24_9HYPO|nr:hypothetical protein EDB81DRAFT_767236 [Dactylonectria macrodidyma]
MKISLTALAVLTSLLGVTTAATHSFCWCQSKNGQLDLINTAKACTRYRNRNTGDEWWDWCPDYTNTLGTYSTTVKYKNLEYPCYSGEGHMGGDEWEYYCRQYDRSLRGYCPA